MSTTLPYYPQSPTQIPVNLKKLPSSYMTKAILAVLAIILFFILYVALVIGLGYLVYYAVFYQMSNINKFTLLMKAGAIAGSIMLFIFTLKFIFKIKNDKPANRIQLNKADHPSLWGFVNQICKETGAPRPKSIYVDPDVNAYVSYSNPWLSLILPVKKELTIGLGLVSCINLSEFKAVITHEFGHFAQSSMKIGSYIMSANTIIHDMIFSRDKWDELLAKWRNSDIRLSAAAWIITPVIWLIRTALKLFYQFLNIMYSSLSREMEFNADKVAVSTSGSDAIVSALWKLDSGSENWSNTMSNAYLASQKKLFADNLYMHNSDAIKKTEDIQLRLLEELPNNDLGGKRYFDKSSQSKANMYASHPPNDHREKNAKNPYILCPTDYRSPWILFDNDDQIQVQMTRLVYKEYLNKVPGEFAPFDKFQAFVRDEQKGKEYLAEYDNTFENRFLVIPDTEELENYVQSKKETDVNSVIKLKDQLKELMKPVRAIEKLMQTATAISQGSSKETSFSFKETTYNKKELEQGYNALLQEREKLFNDSFKDWDKEFCAHHLKLAKTLNKDHKLKNLYIQHNTISNIYRRVVHVQSYIHQQLNAIQTNEDVVESEIHQIGRAMTSAVLELNDTLNILDTIEFVPLSNIEDLAELKEAIIEGGVFIKEPGPIFSNGGINNVIHSIDNTVMHCQRVDQKSIAEILSFHKELTDA